MSNKKTLLFSTGYSNSLTEWENRWRKWCDYHASTTLDFDQILIVDDGSPVVPTWNDLKLITNLESTVPDSPIVFYHHLDNLGIDRKKPFFPGMYRSLKTAVEYALNYGFNRLINIESDAKILSARLCDRINNSQDEWTVLWCPRYEWPEQAISFATGSGLQYMHESLTKKYDRGFLEQVLSFTNIEKNFKGDRYPLFNIPGDADYAAQTIE